MQEDTPKPAIATKQFVMVKGILCVQEGAPSKSGAMRLRTATKEETRQYKESSDHR